MLEIEISLLAKDELENAVEYYNLQQANLGDNFKISVKKVVDSIYENPKLYPKVTDELRRVVIYKFPYSLYYTILVDKIIVISIAHQHRKPFYKIY